MPDPNLDSIPIGGKVPINLDAIPIGGAIPMGSLPTIANPSGPRPDINYALPINKGPVAQQARYNLANLQHESATANYQQDVADAKANAAGQAAAMLPFAVTAPLTGGASLAAGTAAMAGAGLAGGLAREGTKLAMGSSDIPKSKEDLALNLGVDALVGAGTEFGLRGIASGAAKLGGPVWERLVTRSAQKSEEGLMKLADLSTAAHQQVEGMVAGKVANVQPVYRKFLDSIAKVPKGVGQTGQQMAGGAGGRIGELVDAMSNDIASGTVNQPLDAAIRMHRTATEIGWHPDAGQAQEYSTAARTLAKDLRDTITNNMNPVEKQAFEAAKDLTIERKRFDAASEVARFVVKKAIYGTIGAGVGGIVDGKEGAAIGGLAGLGGNLAMEALEKKYAPIVLESMAAKGKMQFQQIAKQASTNPTAIQQIAGSIFRATPPEIRNRIRSDAEAAKVEMLKARITSAIPSQPPLQSVPGRVTRTK